ncbi:MAG: DUF192 domain-containing protein [Bacteroidota bacterium]|jgi:uncharacterized membrane protein (UPF0127 family)
MKKIVAIILVIILLLGGLISTGILNFSKKSEETVISNSTEEVKVEEPQFKKEGELTFTKNQEKLTIEIADNDQETTQGLMYRRTMPDSCGMLFIFPNTEPRNFWMKNTYLPLDILFLDESKKVITIQANRTPFSEEQIPSYENAKYVLEVNAGYCQRKGIEKGEVVKW